MLQLPQRQFKVLCESLGYLSVQQNVHQHHSYAYCLIVTTLFFIYNFLQYGWLHFNIHILLLYEVKLSLSVD
jgi:hypothetical protein